MLIRNLKELVRRGIVGLLTFEAKLVLKKYQPRIILVTGSVGKTSTKDAIYAALSGSFFVRRSEKSFNSDIGVPLTVLGVPNGWSNIFQWARNLIDGASLIMMQAPYPAWLVMEVGADRPGDISKALSWIQPHVVVATRFPDIPVHVEFYASPEEVIQEELTPAAWLPADGIFVANADDPRAQNAPTHKDVSRVSFGFGEDASLKGSHFHTRSEDLMPVGISFDVSYGEEHTEIVLEAAVGRAQAYALLAGLAAAVAVGIPLSKAAEAFKNVETPPGRMRLIPGMRHSVIIDDSYNASPSALEEALTALAEMPHQGRRIAVLADMLELGSFSVPEHRRIGALTAQSADILVTVGVRAKDIAEGARDAGMGAEHIFECERGADAASALVSLVQSGDVVLVKGSQSTRMERVVKSLMAEPEKAKDLLVRQDAEWSIR